MKQLTIKKERFLDWYFSYGQEKENNELKIGLANSIIHQMYGHGFGSYSVQEIFDNCNQDTIRAFFTCQYDMLTDDFDVELSDLNTKYTIKLI